MRCDERGSLSTTGEACRCKVCALYSLQDLDPSLTVAKGGRRAYPLWYLGEWTLALPEAHRPGWLVFYTMREVPALDRNTG